MFHTHYLSDIHHLKVILVVNMHHLEFGDGGQQLSSIQNLSCNGWGIVKIYLDIFVISAAFDCVFLCFKATAFLRVVMLSSFFFFVFIIA